MQLLARGPEGSGNKRTYNRFSYSMYIWNNTGDFWYTDTNTEILTEVVYYSFSQRIWVMQLHLEKQHWAT